MPEPPALIAGPYAPPRVPPSGHLRCAVQGPVPVDGWTDAPIPWPYRAQPGGKRSLIVCDDLARALRTESAQAVAHWWGVSRWSVGRWRRALGVGWWTPGTLARWRALARGKLHVR